MAYGAVQNLTLVVSLARAGEGSTATVTTDNVMQSNGVIHVINGVLQP